MAARVLADFFDEVVLLEPCGAPGVSYRGGDTGGTGGDAGEGAEPAADLVVDASGRSSVQEATYRYTNVDNRWRPYHLVKDWPDRLLAVGDAVCVFNPVYGQGLIVAAMEADLLGRMLARRRTSGRTLDGAARDFQRRVGRMLLTPWTLSTNSDLMWNPRQQPAGARFAHWYNSRLFRVAVRDAAVWSRFVRVVNMTASPAVLFHPVVAAKGLATAFTTSPGGS